MHSITTLTTLLTLLPIFTSAATTVPSSTSQVIVPFSTLPFCAQSCGPLFDAQGACGQTALTATSQSCFCAYTSLTPFRTTTTGVCDAAACSAADITSIQNWYKGYCSGTTTSATTTTGAASAATAASATSAGAAAATSRATVATGRSWISTHYQWVIMIVVVCLGLAAIWTAGCLLRRRHIQKRDRALAMRGGAGPLYNPDNPTTWGPSATHTLPVAGMVPSESQMTMSRSSSGLFGGGPQDNASFYQKDYQSQLKGKSPLSTEIGSGSGAGQRAAEEGRSKGRLSKFLPGGR